MWVPSWDAPRGSSCCVSWIRTFWKSTNHDALTSSMKRQRLLQSCRLLAGVGGRRGGEGGGVEEEISGVKLKTRKEGWNVGGGGRN